MKEDIKNLRRITIIVNSTKVSGAEISLLTTLDTLSSKYSFHVLLPYGSEFYDRCIGKFTFKQIRFKRFKRTNNLLDLIRSVINVILSGIAISWYLYKNRIEIVYSNSNQSHVYIPTIKLLTGKKIILHARDNVSSRIFAKIFSFYSDKIICVSKFIYDQIPAMGSKKVIIYNGINTADWRPINKNDQLSTPNSQQKLLVGCIGQLIPWKRHTDLINAAEMIIPLFKNVHFILLGDDLFNEHTEYVSLLKKIISIKGLSANFSFLGYSPDIKEILAELDLVVHCADGEPFGRVLIESMSMEKPVVAYNCGGPAEVIEHNFTGYLIDPFDTNLLSAQILDLLNNPTKRDNFGRNSRCVIKQKFSIELNSKNMETVFNSI